jgi:plasmid stabilization system protein ParE
MSFDLTFRSQAKQDLEDIEFYYNEINPRLTTRFVREFYETINYIQQEPRLFQIRYRSIHIAPLYRFPYGIHYKITATTIVVYRILHTSRYFK